MDAAGNTITKEKDDVDNKWFIGHPISAIWDYEVTGIWQVNEVEEAAKYGQKPGDPKVANHYTADDRKNADGTTTAVYNNNDKRFWVRLRLLSIGPCETASYFIRTGVFLSISTLTWDTRVWTVII